jgi:hypothetical protein
MIFPKQSSESTRPAGQGNNSTGTIKSLVTMMTDEKNNHEAARKPPNVSIPSLRASPPARPPRTTAQMTRGEALICPPGLWAVHRTKETTTF